MKYFAACATALLLTQAAGVSTAFAADVVPIAGNVHNADQVSIYFSFNATGAGSQSDSDDAAWLTVPGNLATSTSVGKPRNDPGLFASATQTIDAAWSSPNAGTASFDFQALIGSPDFIVGAGTTIDDPLKGILDPSSWTYQFTATTDSLLTFTVSTTSGILGEIRNNPNVPYSYFFNDGSLTINGIGILNLDSSETVTDTNKTVTYELDAGENYLLNWYSQFYVNQASGSDGISIMAGSQDISFSIGARPTDPGGGGTGALPEPATWAMMIAGFGLAGAAMRGSGRHERAVRPRLRRTPLASGFNQPGDRS